MLSTVTSKGQITIPKEIRRLLNINPNDKVDFVVVEGRAVLVPVKSLKNLRGAVKAREGSTFAEEREAAKRAVAVRVREEMS
ncbi:AbrB/MazE/SpoVT family DNA-binding domain-containing protein [Geobacter sp.]|uniref:AbrB/MazE/SpoVT family DNA-binding domain-containing protein n=1 Tax=Geobacter sp. TaxID=46610 RepID=UPI00262EC253|nr:AbrB/MazE/SpoVT family DNA-binding domain-containing protein [Geobacter sp.]